MTEQKKKRHHYVPQFYLRNFSSDGVNVRLFIPESKTIIESAPIKSQMAESYFYGTDPKVENSFADLEGMVSSIFKRLLSSQPFSFKDHFILTFFMSLQHSRTLTGALQLDSMANRFAKEVMEPELERVGISKDEFDVELTQAPLFHLKVNTEIWHFFLDLPITVLQNCTTVPFVASDNPVALHNYYLENESTRGTIGYTTRGLQIFYPISPKILLHWYDSDVYQICSKPYSQYTKFHKESDVFELNSLFLLNSNEVVVVQDSHSIEYLSSLIDSGSHKKPAERAEVNVFSSSDASKILQNVRRNAKETLKINQIRLTKDFNVPVKNRKWDVRSKEAIELHKEFEERVKKGLENPRDFFSFAAKRTREKEIV